MTTNITLAAAVMRVAAVSRPEACRLVRSGTVLLNGRACRNPGLRNVTPSCTVAVGRAGAAPVPPAVWIAFHKPAGLCVTAPGNRNGEPSVYDALGHPDGNLRAVGRLDRETTGLLLFTTDGRSAARLCCPQSRCRKVYRCRLEKPPSVADVASLRAGGLRIRDRKAANGVHPVLPAEAWVCCDEPRLAYVVLVEGRHRQVRRAMRGARADRSPPAPPLAGAQDVGGARQPRAGADTARLWGRAARTPAAGSAPPRTPPCHMQPRR